MPPTREYCSRGHKMDDPYVTTRRDGRVNYQCRPCKKAQQRGEELPTPGDVYGQLAAAKAEVNAVKAEVAELERELLRAYRKLANNA